MKKTLLTTLDFPPKTGGVANYLFSLSLHLPPDRLSVLAPTAVGFVECEAPFRIFRRQCLWWNAPLGWIPLFWHILRLIHKQQIDKIWVGQILPVGTVVWLLSHIMNIPYIVSLHGMDILSADQYSRKRLLMKWILRRAESVTANSEFTARLLQTIADVPSTKIRLVYPCPSVEEHVAPLRRAVFNNVVSFGAEPTTADSIGRNVPNFSKWGTGGVRLLLSVGRLVERKGFDRVITALPKVLHAIPAVHYIVAGEGPYRGHLERLIDEHHVKEQVTLLGYVMPELLKWLYEHAEIFIMPSREREADVEGFGIVFLEANSFGLPVIAGRSGGVSEAVLHEKTGLLVEPNNVDDIARTIILLFQNKVLAKKLGESGKQRVKRDFQWEKQAKIVQTMLE